jgi:hypothetical protein
MMDLGIGEAVPDVVIEIATFGLGRQQLLVNLHGNAEVAVDRSASAASASARTRRAGLPPLLAFVHREWGPGAPAGCQD